LKPFSLPTPKLNLLTTILKIIIYKAKKKDESYSDRTLREKINENPLKPFSTSTRKPQIQEENLEKKQRKNKPNWSWKIRFEIIERGNSCINNNNKR
jgi:hypothetical protein